MSSPALGERKSSAGEDVSAPNENSRTCKMVVRSRRDDEADGPGARRIRLLTSAATGGGCRSERRRRGIFVAACADGTPSPGAASGGGCRPDGAGGNCLMGRFYNDAAPPALRSRATSCARPGGGRVRWIAPVDALALPTGCLHPRRGREVGAARPQICTQRVLDCLE